MMRLTDTLTLYPDFNLSQDDITKHMFLVFFICCVRIYVFFFFHTGLRTYRSACNSRQRPETRQGEKTVQTAELAPIIMAPTQRVVLARTRSSNRHNGTHKLYTGSHSLVPTTTSVVQLAV